jgi:hypothetical protein
MRFPTHPDRQHVSAEVVRHVLDHARPITQRAWAKAFGVTLKTIQAWRAKGFHLGLWSAPTLETWEALKADAVKKLRKDLSTLTQGRLYS